MPFFSPPFLRICLATLTFSLSDCATAQDPSTELSFSGLFDPKPNYPYFSDSKTCPLEASSTFSPTNAQFLAELSMLSYVRDPEITKKRLNDIGFHHIEIFDHNGTFAIAANNGTHTLIAFRGTEAGDQTDFFTDIQIGTAKFGPKGSAHQGFLNALDQIRPQLTKFLKTHHKPDSMYLWVTGHSMGGALATLFALEEQNPKTSLYTYGAPRSVGRKIKQSPIIFPAFRIVNDNDIVPKLVPKPFYEHIGTAIFITSEAEILQDPEALEKWKSHLQGHGNYIKKVYQRYWKHGKFNAIPSDYLADHAPIHYIEMLKKSQQPR